MRASPFRPQPPPLVAKRIEKAMTSRFCMVQEVGPSCFVVQPMGDAATETGGGTAAAPPDGPLPPPATFRVSIGDNQRCSCGDREVCAHILFVMLKVYRCPPDSPLIWQKSLLDPEISKLLMDRDAQQRHVEAALPAAPAAKHDKKCVCPFSACLIVCESV